MLDFTKNGYKLVEWYTIYKRDLPWRNTSDPYLIWVSEVILQQTRVAQGIGYYRRFIKRFPTVYDLAAANTDEVLKYWQGLGYYSRAINLHSAANQIVESFGGKFPMSYNKLLLLKGVGKYTAAAIASIAFNKPVAVVDGNVYRVISRLTANNFPIDTTNSHNEYSKIAVELMQQCAPSLFNQAIMELGALVCTYKNPKCNECPLAHFCVAYKQNIAHLLPVKSKKIKVVDRYLYYFVITNRNFVLMHKRTKKDIWQSLYDFPSAESQVPLNEEEIIRAFQLRETFKILPTEISRIVAPVKHKLTHQNIYASFFRSKVSKKTKRLPEHYTWFEINKISSLAVPLIIEKYVEKEFDIKK